MANKIIRPASLVKQGKLTLYTTSLKVSELFMIDKEVFNLYEIDGADLEQILREQGTPSGYFPVLEGFRPHSRGCAP